MRKLQLIVLSLVLVFALAVLLPVCASADETITVQVEGTYGQTEARGMLKEINQFRTGDEAWYWNEDNKTKTNCPDLQLLEYDYDLEKTAMQRAMEIAVGYSHTRPDGTSCWTAYNVGAYSTMGENIAAGYPTASAVFYGWREDNEDYSGQGHRRNMLNANFNRIGIGHVVVDGVHYWVQELAKSGSSTKKTSALDSKAVRNVDVAVSRIRTITADPVEMTFGESAGFPQIALQTADTWPPYTDVYVNAPNLEWTTDDSDIVGIDNQKIVSLAAGTCSLNASIGGQNLQAEVTVNPKDLSDATVTLGKTSFTYNGLEQKPSVTVEDGDTILEKNTDYTVSYTGNRNATDEAKVSIKGKGNYTGTAEATFAITKAPLTVIAEDCEITYGDEPANAGVAFTGMAKDDTADDLDGSLTFEYSYSQFDAVGSYAITPSGLYSDNYIINYEDGELTVTAKEIGVSWEGTVLTYNGKPQAPEAMLTGVVNDDDVSVGVSGAETNAGSYTATVTGLTGNKAVNYWLPDEESVEFTIEKAMPEVIAPQAKSGLIYTGKDQELIKAGSANGGTISYSLEKDGTYKEAIPTAKTVGTYSVWYKVKGDANYKDVAAASVAVKIGKADSAVAKVPEAIKDLVENDKKQALVSAGKADGGKMQYAVGTDAKTVPTSGWSDKIPSAAEAGVYYVWYMVAGDETHNDTVPETVRTEIIGKVEAFVTRCYKLILRREPDETGLKGWSDALKGKTAAAAQIIDGFVSSQEFINRKLSNGDSVDILYQTMLNRKADAGGKTGWVDALNQGYTLQNIIDGFCGSAEFSALCKEFGIEPGSIGAPKPASPDTPRGKIEAFVRRCYELILSRKADQDGLKGWSDALESRTATAAQIIDGFVRSPEYNNRNLGSAASVDILYNTMLDRKADAGGKAGWVDALSKGYTLQHIINGFCGSAEFTAICDRFGIVAGSVAVSGVMVNREAITPPEGDEEAAPVIYVNYTSEYTNEEKARAFVEHCYESVFGREGDAEGVEAWTKLILEGKKTPKRVAYEFIFSAEFRNQLPGNEDFIRILYKLYLNREPGTEELTGWITMLENGASLEEIVNGFAASEEFKAIVNGMKN